MLNILECAHVHMYMLSQVASKVGAHVHCVCPIFDKRHTLLSGMDSLCEYIIDEMGGCPTFMVAPFYYKDGRNL